MSFSTFTRLNAVARGALPRLTNFGGSQSMRWSSTQSGSDTDTVASSSTIDPSSPSTSSTQPSPRLTHYRVTLRRSAIGLPWTQKRILVSLGLRKRLHSVYQPLRPDVAGKLLALKEILHVDTVRRLDGGEQQARLRLERMLGEAQDASEVANALSKCTVLPDSEAIWVDERGLVVDWGGRPSRKAPRGYAIVGNVANEARNDEIRAARRAQEEEDRPVAA